MKKIIILIYFTLFFSHVHADDDLKFFLEKAISNNYKLNAERKKVESVKQKQNISKSEFLPSIIITGEQASTTSTNRTNQSGESLIDTNTDTEKTTITIEQKIFSGFKGVNTFKKSELENQKAILSLKQVEQQTILDTAFAYYDLIYKFKNEKFNLLNVNLFKRQVEFDKARIQKGEITLTDLAQSESSLSGAEANLIKAKTSYFPQNPILKELQRESPNLENVNGKTILELPPHWSLL